MNFTKHIISSFLICFFLSCSSSTTSEMPIDDPKATSLIFPENKTECNEGTVISETQSKVTFRWNVAEFTDSYEVILENLDSKTTTVTTATTNFAEITLERGAPYKWHVISKSEASTETTASTEFHFYNAAPGIENHAPFPADVIAPVNAGTVTANSGKVFLEWNGADIDNDIKDFEVFFGTLNPATQSIGVYSVSTVEVDVVSGSTYFWMVNTTDDTGNISESEVFSFTVN